MAVDSDVLGVFRFEDCEVNRRTRVLLRAGEVAPLQPRQFDLLLFLIENRDRVVSGSELFTDVWDGLHVQRQSIRYAVHCLRKALGDDGREQRIIKTFPRKGFRFVASCREILPDHPATKRSSLIGRRVALREVGRALDAVREGCVGKVLLISGEAGVGKTSLLDQIAAEGEARSFRVVQARCDVEVGGAAYWPWIQVLRSLTEGLGDRAMIETILRRAPELCWAFPEIGEVASPIPMADANAARSRLFDGYSAILTHVSKDRPIVVCLDDLHQADEDTLKLAASLSGGVSIHRVVFVFGFRDRGPEDDRLRSGWLSKLASGPGVSNLPLKGLSETELGELIQDRFEVEASAPVLRGIHRKTAGNPFFAIQLMNVLREQKRLDEVSGDRFPAVHFEGHVQEVIGRQAGMLPRECRELVELASVIGSEFSFRLLGEAADLENTELIERIEPAFTSGVLSGGGAPGLYRFVHPLLREAIYAGLTVGRRCELHRCIGNALETVLRPDPSEQLGELARHFAASHPHPEAEKAIRYFLGAADLDVDRAAFDSARASLESAVALARNLLITESSVWCKIRLRLGIVYGLLAHRKSSRRELKRASQAAAAGGDSDVLCRAALAFSPDLLAVETGVMDEELIELLRSAVSVARSEAHPLLPRLLARLAVALHWSDDANEELHRLTEEALALVNGAGGAAEREFVAVASEMARYRPGQAVSEARRRVRTVGEEEDVSAVLMRGVLCVTRRLELGEIRLAEAEIERLSDDIERFEKENARWYPRMFRATIALLRGEYPEASLLMDEYLERGLAVDDHNAFHSFALQRSMMAVDVGGLEEFEGAVAKMGMDYPAVEGWDAGLCYLQSEIGRFSAARERAAALIDSNVLESIPRNSWLGTIGCLALASRNMDVGTHAARLYERWKPYAGKLAVVGYGSFCWGAADRFLGVLAGMLGDRETSRAYFDSACDLNERADARPALAHCLRDRGFLELEWASGEGEGYLRDALDLAREAGMGRFVERLETGHPRTDAMTLAGG